MGYIGAEPESQHPIEQNFLKSHISLAETYEDETRRSQGSYEDTFGEESLVVSELYDDDYDAGSINATDCLEFLLKGYCMKGRSCQHPHGHLSTRRTLWTFVEHFPELLITRNKRIESFLA